jgi:hypothetical protein
MGADSYQDFHDRGFLLAKKLQKQRFLLVKLKTPLRSFMVATTTRYETDLAVSMVSFISSAIGYMRSSKWPNL